ncbi:hypothetical protein V6582_05670 [Agrobacterium vitis]|uniref:hypothetical protein n=1 Tax=Agrobacterium vitis TaxID=373 RepID=UPI0012E814E6|nr:hypothetical protein [Agrobacterium vitis]MVA24506.1 hypothetical protein [Agrobacterium vitis]
MMCNGTYLGPDGLPTDREAAAADLRKALGDLMPNAVHPFEHWTEDQEALSEAVSRLTEGYGRRVTAAMIADVRTIVTLARLLQDKKNG